MIRRLYDWTISLAESPYALWALFIVAFAEASFFPIPPDVLLIAMVIATPKRWWQLAGIATIGSVLGALAGYAIGAFAFSSIGEPVLAFYGMTDSYARFQIQFAEYGVMAVLIGGLTPIPFKVLTILSGAVGFNLGLFLLSSLIARAIRFFIVAALLWKFGPAIRDFIEKRLTLMFTLGCILLIGGFFALKYFH